MKGITAPCLFCYNCNIMQSKLHPHLDNLLAMRRKGLSYRQMQKLLAAENVIVHFSEIHRFLVSRRRKAIALARELKPFDDLGSFQSKPVVQPIQKPSIKFIPDESELTH